MHACELYDALPVHRVVGRRPRPAELRVGIGDSGVEWRSRPARDDIVAYLDGHDVKLEDGQVAEINLEARPLHARLLGLGAGPGVALVLDYGYEARRLYDPRGRRGGALATYHRHQAGRDPLDRPGELDITSHVNWDDLRAAAASVGWREVGLWPLAELLVRGGLAAELDDAGLGMEADLDARTVSARQDVKLLLDPEGMGSDLKALVQCTVGMENVVREVFALAGGGP
jgi:SAM-dependent MidA family methyltransferase